MGLIILKICFFLYIYLFSWAIIVACLKNNNNPIYAPPKKLDFILHMKNN